VLYPSIVIFTVLTFMALPARAADLGNKNGVLWEHLEWSLDNAS
jgi:hypothetical protein